MSSGAKFSLAFVTEICGRGVTIPGLRYNNIVLCLRGVGLPACTASVMACHGCFSVTLAGFVLLFVELRKPWTFQLLQPAKTQ